MMSSDEEDAVTLSERRSVRTDRCNLRGEEFDVIKAYGGNDKSVFVYPGVGTSISDAPHGLVPIYVRAFQAGLRLPPPPWVSTFFRNAKIPPFQLAANAWRRLMAFAVACHRKGIHPSYPLFLRLFDFKISLEDQFYATPKQSCGIKWSGDPSSVKGWRGQFCFLRVSSEWNFSFPFTISSIPKLSASTNLTAELGALKELAGEHGDKKICTKSLLTPQGIAEISTGKVH